jgi:hypothetical protein
VAGVLLSGYLPDKDHNGVDHLADDLVARFEAAYADGDRNPVQVVVVAVLDVETVKHNRDPEAKPPTAGLKVAAIEAATGRHADQLRWVLAALTSRRNGQPALDGFDEVVTAMLEGRDDLPPAPPEVIDGRGGTSTTGDG